MTIEPTTGSVPLDYTGINLGNTATIAVPNFNTNQNFSEPIAEISYWKNGLTNAIQKGFPPYNWIQGNDGAWVPTVVAPVGGLADPNNPPSAIININPNKPVPGQLSILVSISVSKLPEPVSLTLPVNVKVYPAIPVFATSIAETVTNLIINPIPIELKTGSLEAIRRLLTGKVNDFFDDSRQLKTLLNFGNDYQALITNWIYDPSDNENILVKLYTPLPDEVEEKTQLWISRELSPPVIDRLYVKYTPPPPPKVYLRPANKNVKLTGRRGVSVENVTYSSLFSSGAFAIMGQSDPVIQEWFTDDVNSVELNIDYSDYKNFIFFGSAKNRVLAFTQKLAILEDYDKIINFNSSSLTNVSSQVTGTLTYPSIKSISEKRVDLIRSFDPYERFLYYKDQIPYSSSFSDDDDDQFFFNTDATWPKISGSIVPVASASSWMTTQLAIADEFDRQNQDRLVNSLPTYLNRDSNSDEFIRFVDMIGHQFDLMKPYIDQMTTIYDRGNDPKTGLSPDIIWNVAEAFGVSLPNQYAINKLIDYTIGDKEISATVYRDAATETWKRFLHNQLFLTKTKGTKTSLRALANCYGILPTTLQIRESTTFGNNDDTKSFETFEEQTNVLNIPAGAHIIIPWASSSVVANSIELRFSTTNNTNPSVLLSADNTWALQLIPLSGSYGRLSLSSGSVECVSSSVMPFYTGDFYSTLIRYNSSGVELQVKIADEGDIVNSFEAVESSNSIANVFHSPSWIYLGGSGSFFGAGYSGLIDELRIWGESINDDVFEKHVKYPGLYGGNTNTSARDNLYVRLSFNIAKNLGGNDKTIDNESPYVKYNSGILNSFQAVAFPSINSAPYNMEVILREVTRFNLNAGANQFTSNKIIIEDTPALKYFGSSSIPILSTNQSIVSLKQKEGNSKSTNVVGFYFSITEAINDSIIRSLGDIDLQSLIGDPSDIYSSYYKPLSDLSKIYWESYAYGYNVNRFVDFVRNLLEPLFEQARQLVPARAKLLSGIVHEPNVLERSKIANKKIQFSAGRFGRDNQMQNLEADTVTSQPNTIAGEYVTTDAIYDLQTQWNIISSNDTFESNPLIDFINKPQADLSDNSTTITTQNYQSIFVEFNNENGQIYVTDSYKPSAFVAYYDDATNLESYQSELLNIYGAEVVTQLSGSKLSQFNHQLSIYRSPSTINITGDYFDLAKKMMRDQNQDDFIPPTIQPYTNFDDVESYTYFTDKNGYVGYTKLEYKRNFNSVLNNRGTWSKGSIYSRYDLVVQDNVLGDAENGNGKEFVCISTNSSFVSYIEPYLDTKNWKSVNYIPVKVLDIRKAVLINDKVSITPTSSAFPIAQGYLASHYKNTRDRRRGILNHLWLGCLQTQDTTTDGRPPVEEFRTSGDILIVNNGSEPIQSSVDQAGPILDIR